MNLHGTDGKPIREQKNKSMLDFFSDDRNGIFRTRPTVLIFIPHRASETRQLPSCISTGRISLAGYLI